MENYKEDIVKLIKRDYSNSPVDEHQPVLLSTHQLYKQAKGVVPEHAITEHEIYEIMKELEFEIFLVTFYEKDEDGNKTEEIAYQGYRWLLYMKNKLSIDN